MQLPIKRGRRHQVTPRPYCQMGRIPAGLGGHTAGRLHQPEPLPFKKRSLQRPGKSIPAGFIDPGDIRFPGKLIGIRSLRHKHRAPSLCGGPI